MNEKCVERIIKHEGLKLKPYRCTAGKLTIGVGRNLDDNGITEEEARYLLKNDLNRCHAACLHEFPVYIDLDEARKSVVLEMCFNLGLARLKQFTKMFDALNRGLFSAAAHEMLNSRWAQQVGLRAKTLAMIMESGY